jgi:hypothetical protein
MAYKTQIAPRKAFQLIAGDRAFVDLVNAVQTHSLRFTAAATATIGAGGGTAILNRGSIWALFDELGLSENGVDKCLLNGRMARFFAEMVAPSQLSATRLGSTAAGAYPLKETLTIHFAWPLAASPAETTFREHVVKNAVSAFAKLTAAANGGIGKILSGAPAGSSITTPTLKIEHVYDQRTTRKPHFIPTFRQLTLAIPSAATDWQLDIKTTKFLRALVVQSDSDAGEVPDIINNLQLIGDFRQLIGPGATPWDDLIRAQEGQFGGQVFVDGATFGQKAYLGQNFQQGGRLSNVINPADDVNLRFIFDAQPSALAGATNGKIVVALAELETDPDLTNQVGSPGFPPV